MFEEELTLFDEGTEYDLATFYDKLNVYEQGHPNNQVIYVANPSDGGQMSAGLVGVRDNQLDKKLSRYVSTTQVGDQLTVMMGRKDEEDLNDGMVDLEVTDEHKLRVVPINQVVYR